MKPNGESGFLMLLDRCKDAMPVSAGTEMEDSDVDHEPV